MKTAIDHYPLGNQKEIEAANIEYPEIKDKGRLTCPECGENVHFRSGKYSNHFSHYKKTKTSAECDRRVDGDSLLTIYERLGLPLYLRINNGEFYLSVGFRAVSYDVLQKASEDKAYIEICEKTKGQLNKVKYYINEQRFSAEDTTFIPVNFIPRNEEPYEVLFSRSAIRRLLKQVWSDYIDGFSNAGALFTANEYGGKKIRHGDSISTSKTYYWVRRDVNLPKGIPGIKMMSAGKIILRKEKYYIFKGQFMASLSNENKFKKLADYLRDNMKVFLLEKQPEVIPVWPPCVRVVDGYEVPDKGKDIYCNVISGNEVPKVFSYHGYNISPIELLVKKTGKENNIVSFKVSSDLKLINVDRKMISTGSYFKYHKLRSVSLDSEIIEVKNNEEIDVSSLDQNRINKEMIFSLLGKVDIIKVSGQGDITRVNHNESVLEINRLKYQDRFYILSHNRVIYSANIRRDRDVREGISGDGAKLHRFLQAHSRDARVTMPIRTRKDIIKILQTHSNLKQYLYDYLQTNTLPISVVYLLGGKKYGGQRL